MKKTIILLFLISFSFSQNMGILKTNKNKSGLGVFITSHFMFKSDSREHNIRDLPDRFRVSLNYSFKSNIDIAISSGYVEAISNDGLSENYSNTALDLRYHFFRKKWGSSIEINKTEWLVSETSLLSNDKVGLGFTLYSKTKYNPYISFKNYFFEDESSQEIFTFGGMRQVNQYIMHWGLNIWLDDNSIEISKDNASFFVGTGIEFF